MKSYICSNCGSKMEMKGRVMACPVLTIPMKDDFKSVMLTQCVKCQNIEFEWF